MGQLPTFSGWHRFLALLALSVLISASVAPAFARSRPPAKPKRFVTEKPVRVVVVGGSITAHPANFMKFLHKRCANIEVINFGKARLKARALLRRFREKVRDDQQLVDQLKKKEGWLVYLGGLNGIYLPKRTRKNIAATFSEAHAVGLKVAALTLPPWGSLEDGRFFDYEGLFNLKATALVNDFLRSKPGTFSAKQLPDLVLDIYNSKLRDKRARLRSTSEISPRFSKSRYRRRRHAKRSLTRQARYVPRMFMKRKYRGRYHFHPNWRGHRVIAHLFCKNAPVSWACDCKKIARSWPKNGRIYP